MDEKREFEEAVMDELVMHNPDVDVWFTARAFDGRYGLYVEIIPHGTSSCFSYYARPLLQREVTEEFRLHRGMDKMVLNKSNFQALSMWLRERGL